MLKSLAQIGRISDLIKGVIVKINDDIVQNKQQKPLSELQGLAAAVGWF